MKQIDTFFLSQKQAKQLNKIKGNLKALIVVGVLLAVAVIVCVVYPA